jgi:hypothetical protein
MDTTTDTDIETLPRAIRSSSGRGDWPQSHVLNTSSRLLMASMIPLAIGISLEVYVIRRAILGTVTGAAVVAVMMLAVLFVFWRVVPQSIRGGRETEIRRVTKARRKES